MYKYKNIKHCVICGIEPGQVKEFSHPLIGGGLVLVTDEVEQEEVVEEKVKKSKRSKRNKEMI